MEAEPRGGPCGCVENLKGVCRSLPRDKVRRCAKTAAVAGLKAARSALDLVIRHVGERHGEEPGAKEKNSFRRIEIE